MAPEPADGGRGEGPRIPPKQAVTVAKDAFKDVTGLSDGLFVEELELNPDRSRWLVTISYVDSRPGLPNLVGGRKAHKVFEIDAATGEVIAMKIRDL